MTTLVNEAYKEQGRRIAADTRRQVAPLARSPRLSHLWPPVPDDADQRAAEYHAIVQTLAPR